MPAIQSAFTEQAVRKDSHQLALMVKTAMIQSAEQHRNYVIDLTNNTMALHPADPATSQADTSADTSAGNDADTTAAAGSVPTRIRLSRGDAWLEMSFNALTGNVENETASFP